MVGRKGTILPGNNVDFSDVENLWIQTEKFAKIVVLWSTIKNGGL